MNKVPHWEPEDQVSFVRLRFLRPPGGAAALIPTVAFRRTRCEKLTSRPGDIVSTCRYHYDAMTPVQKTIEQSDKGAYWKSN